MYLRHYGFRRPPFANTPDPRFFFRSPRHNEALAALLYTVRARKGLAVLTGEVGAGKTTVARALLRNLEPDTARVVITNTHLTSMQLLQAIARGLGVAPVEAGRVELLQQLERFLLAAGEEGRDVVILVDEAQNLSPQALEELRMLLNFETEEEKLLQLLLLGQPELSEKLDRPDLRQFRQRIAVRYHLEALSRAETYQYVLHRLRVAGPEARVKFTRPALKAVYAYSRGIPRLVNTLCDNALLLGYVRQSHRITGGIVSDVIRELDGLRRRSTGRPLAGRRTIRFFGWGSD